MIIKNKSRRKFINFASKIGLVYASGLFGKEFIGNGMNANALEADFFFLQLSDIHWGFKDDKINPFSDKTFKKAIDQVNSLKKQPDFIIFTGDLTDITDDENERRKRMQEFKEIVKNLKVKNVKFIPGEHDASLDNGKVYKEFFGETYYSFKHKGINFISIDNVSDPTSSIGEVQIEWIKNELSKLNPKEPLVVFTHRPLFDLMPAWDWATKDGSKVISLFEKFDNVHVFYGHIHQTNYKNDGKIKHHASNSLIFPLPAPGSLPKKIKIPWNSNKPFENLGYTMGTVEEKSKAIAIKDIELK